MKTTNLAFLFAFTLYSPQIALSAPPGKVIGWGGNTGGQAIGIPSEKPPFIASGAVVLHGVPLTNVVTISAGSSDNVAMRSDSTVAVWAGNVAPNKNSNLNDTMLIAAGVEFSVAVSSNGIVTSWGSNLEGAPPKRITNVVAIAIGEAHSIGLREDGTVVHWGKLGSVVNGPSNAIAIAACTSATWRDLALTRDGRVVEWGLTGSAVTDIGLSNIAAIATGGHHSLALNKDGTVFGWGSNAYGEATGIPTSEFPRTSKGIVTTGGQVLSNVVAIAAGGQFSLALRKDGTVVAWGDNHWGETNIPSNLTNVVAIAAGPNFALALVATNK